MGAVDVVGVVDHSGPTYGMCPGIEASSAASSLVSSAILDPTVTYRVESDEYDVLGSITTG